MRGKPKFTKQDLQLDQFCGEMLSAVRVSEDEVTATASSSYGYDRVRLRIAKLGQSASRRGSVYERLRRLNVSLLSAPRFVVLSGAAAILLLFAAALFVLLPGTSSVDLVEPASEAVVPSTPVEQKAERETVVTTTSRADDQSQRTRHRRQRLESRSSEVATDFLPLTFVEDSSAQQSGHVVRMKVPRSALIAFGVPMNMERAGELITADVVIGDDGLARAIRFVQ